MMTLITGGSKSGKSAAAESLAAELPGKKFYIATMEPFGAEAEAAITRHRRQREGKGFVTVERYTDVARAPISPGSVVLLECVANLCANETFSAKVADPVEKIAADIAELNRRAGELIVVTSQVGGDGFFYPPETAEYIRNIGRINGKLAEMADRVIETVCGIPVILKGGSL